MAPRKSAQAAKPKAARKTRPAKPAEARPKSPKRAAKSDGDVVKVGGRTAKIVSVFGPFNSRTLIELSTETAEQLFDEVLERSARTNVIEAAERDVAAIGLRDPELAESALAAAAIALAYEIVHPYNSATSKSMCAREMRDTLDRLRELAPPSARKDGIDDLDDRRKKRLAKAAATARRPRAANQKRP